MMNLFSTRFWRSVSFLAVGAMIGMAPSDGTSSPDQIEEDWEVVIADPDPVGVGPQITMCMNPTSDPTGNFFTFYLNYRDYPDWHPGGLQLKAYDKVAGPNVSPDLLVSDSQGTEICSTEGETVKWTQRLGLSGQILSCEVVNGQSTTWGSFGQNAGDLRVSFTSTVSDLSAYKPEYSTSKSGVSWQSNRVSSLTLVQVRYYSGGNLISTDTTPRTVDLTAHN
jgi:hypothetical protein